MSLVADNVTTMIDSAIAAIGFDTGLPFLAAGSADAWWLMMCAFFVFFMQCGFALLEAGTVRAKNTKNILLKNLLDACVGAMIWYAWGHAIAVRSPAR